jgi:hypothetical protein
MVPSTDARFQEIVTMFRKLFHCLRPNPTRRQAEPTRRVRLQLEALEDRLTPANVIWNLNADGDFNTAANWNVQGTNPVEHRVPGPGDDASVNTTQAITVRLNSGDDITVHTLTLNDHLLIDGGAAMTIAAGNANLIGGITLANGGNLHVANTNTSVTISTAGISTYAGALNVDTGARLIFDGPFQSHELNAGTTFAGAGLYLRSGFNVVGFNVNAPLTFPQNFELDAGTMSLNADITIGQNFTQGQPGINGSIAGPGNVTVPVGCTYTWNGGTIQGAGRLDIQSGGTLAIPGGDALVLSDRTVNNAGTINWTGPHGIQGGNATVNNLADGVFNISNDQVFVSHSSTNFVTFNNAGTVTKTSALPPGAGATRLAVVFNNTGTVHVNSGTLTFTAGTSSGTLDIGSGAVASFNPGAGQDFYFTSGAQVMGDGLLDVQANVSAAAVHFDTDLSVPNLRQESGVLTGTGNVTVTDTFYWTNANVSGTNTTLTVAQGGTFLLEGAGQKNLVGRSLVLNGATTWKDMGILNLQTLQASPTVTNNGTFTIQNDQAIFGGGAFLNAGTLTKTAGTGTTTIANGVAFSNSGTVNVQSGILDVQGGFVQSAGNTVVAAGAILQSSGSHHVTINGGTLSGFGSIGSDTVSTDVTNGGTVSPGSSPGLLTINGSYTQSAAGTLAIELGGTTVGTQFDQLKVTGAATLNGTLALRLVNGLTPRAGDSFPVLTFASETGDFAVKSGLDLGGGLSLVPALSASNLTLTATAAAVPPPPGPSPTPSPAPLTGEVTALANVTLTIVPQNKKGKPRTFRATLTLRNLAGQPLQGPVSVVLGGLKKGIKVIGAAGFFSSRGHRSPFVVIPAGGGMLLPQASVRITLQFSSKPNPIKAAVFAGSPPR